VRDKAAGVQLAEGLSIKRGRIIDDLIGQLEDALPLLG